MKLYKNIIKAATLLTITSVIAVSPAAVFATQTEQQQTTTETQSKSKDNSLSSLSLSDGELSPSFKYDITSYTATVDNDVTGVEVYAELTNSNATINSVSGNTDFKVGENTIKITTTSEAGTQAVYVIVVTRLSADDEESSEETSDESEKAASDDTGSDSQDSSDSDTQDTSSNDGGIKLLEDGTVKISDTIYNISEEFSDDIIPDGFSRADITVDDETKSGMKNEFSTVSLLYLVSQSDSLDTRLCVIDEQSGELENYLRMTFNDKYVIAIPRPSNIDIPDDYNKITLNINDVDVYVYESAYGGAFYLFYGADDEGGSCWYQYDSKDGTYQRYNEDLSLLADSNSEYVEKSYDELKEKYDSLKSRLRIILIISVIIILVLLVLMIKFLRESMNTPKQDGVWAHKIDEEPNADESELGYDDPDDGDEFLDEIEDENDEEEQYLGDINENDLQYSNDFIRADNYDEQAQSTMQYDSELEFASGDYMQNDDYNEQIDQDYIQDEAPDQISQDYLMDYEDEVDNKDNTLADEEEYDDPKPELKSFTTPGGLDILDLNDL